MRNTVLDTRLDLVLVSKWILKLALAPLLAPLFLIAVACWICVWFTGCDTGTESSTIPKVPSNLGDTLLGVLPLTDLPATRFDVCPL